MLNGERQNTHHSKLPAPGVIGRIVGLSTVKPRRRCLVVAYPLTDIPDYRFSLGIHTVYVRFFDNGEIARFSAIWFREDES